MIKVLHFVPALDGGGIERVLYNYYINMNKHEVHFDFAIHSRKNGILGDEFIKKKSKIYYVTPKRTNILKYMKDVVKAIKSDDYDIIHVHQGFKSWIPLCIGAMLGCKTRIVHSHNCIYKERIFVKLLQQVERRLINIFATDYMACGDDAAKWLYGNTMFDSNKVAILKNAININDYIYNKNKRQIVRKNLNIEDKICIGHVGRFSEQKNHKFLIDIFSEIHKVNKNVVLLLVGSGELFNDIKEKAEDRGLEDNIKFLGVRSDANELYQAMDIFVFPSLFEGLGIAAVEAQTSGIECFVSDVIPKEVKLSDHINFLSLRSSAKYWADNIIDRIENIKRYDATKEVICNGYSIEKEANKLIGYYEKLYNRTHGEHKYENM